MITTTLRSDITTITADIAAVPDMESRTYRADSGAPFAPRRVVLTLSRVVPADKWTPAVLVEVTGPNYLKSGKTGQQILSRKFSSDGGGPYTISGSPLDQMPEWLAQWVQQAPDEGAP